MAPISIKFAITDRGAYDETLPEGRTHHSTKLYLQCNNNKLPFESRTQSNATSSILAKKTVFKCTFYEVTFATTLKLSIRKQYVTISTNFHEITYSNTIGSIRNRPAITAMQYSKMKELIKITFLTNMLNP